MISTQKLRLLNSAETAVIAGQYLIALNMFNQAPLMPRMIRQILSLLTKLPYGAAYVSIYESNSWDFTGRSMNSAADLTLVAMHSTQTLQGVAELHMLCSKYTICAGQWLGVLQQLLELFAYPHTIEQGGQLRVSASW